MEREIVIGMIRLLVKYNIIPSKYLRDQKIRKEYYDFLAHGLPAGYAKQKLSEKFCMSYKNVEDILYRRKIKQINSTDKNLNSVNNKADEL